VIWIEVDYAKCIKIPGADQKAKRDTKKAHCRMTAIAGRPSPRGRDLVRQFVPGRMLKMFKI